MNDWLLKRNRKEYIEHQKDTLVIENSDAFDLSFMCKLKKESEIKSLKGINICSDICCVIAFKFKIDVF